MFEMTAVRILLILAVIVSFNLVFLLNEETLNVGIEMVLMYWDTIFILSAIKLP